MTTCLRAFALSALHTLVLAPLAIAQCTTFSPTAYSQVTAPGCGAPVLSVSAPPRFGWTTSVDATNLDLGFGIQVVVFAFKLPPPSLPAAWTSDVEGFPLVAGCFNHLPDADTYVVQISTSGVTSTVINVPASGFVAGSVVRAQAFQLDLLSSTFAFSAATNSVCLYLAP